MIQFNKKLRGWLLLGVIALLSTLGLSSSMLPAAQGDAPGIEIPVSKKKVSQTIRKRFAYTVSYNHDTRQPNWVAWSLTRAHASGKLKRGDFEDDMDMPSPKGMKADTTTAVMIGGISVRLAITSGIRRLWTSVS